MLFSIVVPVYNVEKYLDECLQSIIKQVKAFPELCEIILIDDGSTDSSGKICDRYQKQAPEAVRVFHNTNQGLLLTRRFGYKYATGEYIINCDSDDVLEEDALENLKSVIDSFNKPDMIVFNHYLYNGVKKKIAFENILSNKPVCTVNKIDVLRQFLIGYSIVSVWSSVCKKSCIDVDKDYTSYAHISNGEDSLQKIEFFDRAKTYVYLNKALYNYRVGSGMTGKFDSLFYFSFKIVINNILERKEYWQIPDFDQLLTEKILTITGRAITQSRYGRNLSFSEHIRYLKQLREDDLVDHYIKHLAEVKKYLQKDHVILLFLLKKKYYLIIIMLLKLKNITALIS